MKQKLAKDGFGKAVLKDMVRMTLYVTHADMQFINTTKKTQMNKLKYIFDNKFTKKEIEWLLGQFPEDHESMNFIVYNDKNLISVVNKKKSNIEIVLSDDNELNNFYKVTRDQSKNLVLSLKKLSHKKKIVQELSSSETKTNLKQAEKYVFFQKMTKNQKIVANAKKANDEWSKTISSVKTYSDRIKDIHFVELKDPEKFLKTFSSQNYFIFLCMYKTSKSINDIIEIKKCISNSKAKILIFDNQNPIIKKLFAGWTYKKITKKDSTNNFCVWKNF